MYGSSRVVIKDYGRLEGRAWIGAIQLHEVHARVTPSGAAIIPRIPRIPIIKPRDWCLIICMIYCTTNSSTAGFRVSLAPAARDSSLLYYTIHYYCWFILLVQNIISLVPCWFMLHMLKHNQTLSITSHITYFFFRSSTAKSG